MRPSPRLSVLRTLAVATALATASLVAAGVVRAESTSPGLVGICSSSNCATVTITPTGSGFGTVTSADGFIDCHSSYGFTTGTCANQYVWSLAQSTLDVSLTATPDAGSVFCYSTDLSSCAPEGRTMNLTIVLSNGMASSWSPVFHLTTRTLTVAVAGAGHGTVYAYAANVVCPTQCSNSLPYGWEGPLMASPAPGSVFSHWTGACAGQSANCSLSITANVTTTAVFDLAATPTPAAARTATVAPAASKVASPSASEPPATGSPGTSTSDAAASPTATPTGAPSPSPQPTDPAPISGGSDGVPWLPIVALVALVVIGANVLVFQILRSRR